MSVLFLKRFLQRPRQIASIIPSSRTLIRRVVDKMDLAQPRVVAEYGPGEGCHTREIVRRMHPESRLLLFELDAELAAHLRDHFRNDARVTVLNADAASLPEQLLLNGLTHCDYVLSGIPFSLLEPEKKRALLKATHDALRPAHHAAFIIYQVTNELRQHATLFQRATSEYFLQNIPPMFITVFGKAKTRNGRAHPASNGARVPVHHSA